MIAFFLFFVIPLAILIFGASYLIAKSLEPIRPMSEIVDELLQEKKVEIAKDLAKEMMKDPLILFLKQIQWELMKVDSNLSPESAFSIAKVVLSEFLKDEKISFGDSKFDWDEEAAIALAWAYEIEYWDEN